MKILFLHLKSINLIVVVRYIEYEFEAGNKLKEIRFIYKKKSLRDNVIYVYRTMYMLPNNFDSICIVTEKVEQKHRSYHG